MKPKVYIDGKEGTTGLQIYDRLAARDDIDLLLIDEDKRKDPAERRKLMAAAGIVFLCLPDAAAVEAVALAEGASARIIDCFHRPPDGPGLGLRLPGAEEGAAGGDCQGKIRGQSRLPRHGLYLPSWPRWSRRECCPLARISAVFPSPVTPAAARR